MDLSRARISVQIAVSDMARAREFYEGKLGLPTDDGPNPASRGYPCGAGTALYIYESPANAGTSTATQARWDVDDIDQIVDDLTARGVVFEQYREPVPTDARGIHDSGYGRIAWIADPDGNIFEISQARQSPTQPGDLT